MKLDVLAFGAHPDDIELSVGGTLIKLTARGYQTGVVDMTRGELGTRGTPQIRKKEARAAAKVLGLKVRDNLALKDGSILSDPASRLKVVRTLRKYRPSLVFTHYWDDKHPDHVHTSHLVTEACYLSGLDKVRTGQERFRPQKIVYFTLPYYVVPSFVVDVSEHFDKKMAAIRCFRSQLHDPESPEPQTYLSLSEFLPALVRAHEYYGYLIGTRHGEAFYCKQAIALEDPIAALVEP